MTELLRSSLYGMDFVNYRKNTKEYERQKFSNKVRSKGIGQIPIVVDSVDKELSLALAKTNIFSLSTYNDYTKRYGKEYIVNMDLHVKDFLYQITTDLKITKSEKIIKMGLETGEILDANRNLGDIYKKFRNKSDNILYILITSETTMYSYILSVLRYLGIVH
jgi:hypothetical protein